MSEFAPLYSTRERIRLVAIMGAAVIGFYLFGEFWLEPFVFRYAQFANCYQYGAFNGVEVLWYSGLVGLPLSVTVVFAIMLVPGSLRAIRARQYPPPGEKVLRPTRYRRGGQALILPVVQLFIILFMLGVSVLGGLQAHEMTRQIEPCSDEQRLELGRESERET